MPSAFYYSIKQRAKLNYCTKRIGTVNVERRTPPSAMQQRGVVWVHIRAKLGS